MIKSKNFPLLLVTVAAFIGGAIVPALKIGLKTFPPMSFTFLRFLLSSLFLLYFLLKEVPKIEFKKEVVYPSLLSSANIILFIYAVRYIPANIGQLIYVMTPVFVGVLSLVYLKDRLSISKISGIGLGLLGTLILLLTNTISGFSFKGNYLGFFMILVGAVLYSIYLVNTKKLQIKYSPLYITAIFNITTAIVAFFLAFGEFRTLMVWVLGINLKSLGVLLYVSIMGTAAFYLLGQYIVKHASPVLSSIVQYVQVPFTIMWAYLLIGEKITPNFLLAAVMITVGAYLASR